MRVSYVPHIVGKFLTRATTFFRFDFNQRCRNLNFGFATKVRAYKSAGQERSLGVTFHAPGSAKECEGMNPHTPKGIPTLRVRVSVDS
jgi:hypothetical protein